MACKLSDRLPSHPVCQYLQPDPADRATASLASEAMECQRLLIISGDATLRAKVSCFLPKSGYLVDEATTAAQGRVLIEQNDYALIVCDEQLPDKTAWEILDALGSSGLLNLQPMVIIADTNDADNELRALRLGAAGVIDKSAISDALLPRMQSIISRYESMRIAEQNKLYDMRMEQKEQMLLLAEYDEVTGLYNRQAFYRRVRETLDANPQTTYAIFRWDMDNFKMLNDFFGVATGDKVLRDLAVAAQESFSDDTILGRLQSDHFIAFSPMQENLLEERYRVLLEVAENYPLDFHFSFRMGVYIINDPTLDVPLMCDRALLALRSVNNNYTNHIAFYDDSLRDKLVEEQALLGQFPKAIEDQEFVLYFQPQYDYSGEDNLLISSEALVRWNHAEKGLLMPGRFIPLFEKTGFILALDQYVWERACQHLRDWTDRGIDPLPVSVNISRLSVCAPNIVEIFCSLIKQYDLDPSLLHLEITESAYMDDPELIIEVVRKLQHEGFFVEMDDFGSGYSSLNTLKDVPVDLLKLDMRFLSNTKSGARSGIIINSVLRMAHWLNMPVIAEGVETIRQADYLKTSGCVLAQGYLFGKPMPAEEYESLMERSKTGVSGDQLFVESSFDFEDFWSPEAQETVIFSSFVGAAGIFEYCNGALAAMRINDKFFDELNITRESMVQVRDNVLVRLHPADLPVMLNMLDEATLRGTEATCETRWCLSPAGAVSWLRIRCRRVARSMDCYALFLSVENITALKESELMQSQDIATERIRKEHRHSMRDLSDAAIFEYDCGTDTLRLQIRLPGKGNTEFRHERYWENFGSNPSSIDPAFVKRYQKEFQKALEHPSEGALEYMADHFGSGLCWNRWHWASIADADGQVYHIMGVIKNIQSEKEAALPSRAVYRFDLRSGQMEMPKNLADRFGLPALLKNLPESLAENGMASQQSMPECRKMFADIAAGVSQERYPIHISNQDGSYVCDWCDCYLIIEGGKPVGATLTLNASVDQGGAEKI